MYGLLYSTNYKKSKGSRNGIFSISKDCSFIIFNHILPEMFFSHSGSCTKFYIGEFLNKLNYPAYTNINGDLPLSAVT